MLNSTQIQPILKQEKLDSNSPEGISLMIQEFLNHVRNRESTFDMKFGVRSTPDGWMIGDKLVEFDRNYLYIGNNRYEASTGLLELMFKREPSLNYTKNDEETYKRILEQTNAHRKNFTSDSRLSDDRTEKVQRIMKPKFSGDGLPSFMIERKKKKEIDYVYWDDPNELVDRLRLLIGSQAAGNTSHSNEIMSIIEELRESRIIY